MTFTLKKIAELTNSTPKGDINCILNAVAPLHEARLGDISFVSNSKYKKLLKSTKASVVILSPTLANDFSGNMLINNDPYLTFAKVVNLFNPIIKQPPSIHPSAIIADNTIISQNVSLSENVVIDTDTTIMNGVTIGAGSYIGSNVTLKENVVLHPNTTIYSNTVIGNNSVIHSGAIIGADGFGYAPQKDKSWYKILQVGNVVIGENVEIGANTTIDRAALGSTIIRDGVKIDNQIQIGHNTIIGQHTAIAAGTLIAGSTTIGDYCQIAGAVAIAGHLDIANNVIITGKTMVTKSIDKAGVYSSGTAADENKKWRRNTIRFSQLDEIAKTITQLEKKIALMMANDKI